jgi:hypothetical protein
LGAIVYGRTTTELLQLNEDSVWYGDPQDRTPRDALKNLGRLWHLIRNGDNLGAEKLVRQSYFATPHSQRHYELLGSLTLEFDHKETDVKNYERVLDLETAVTRVRYEHHGTQFSRRVFASHPDNVVVVQLDFSRRWNVK